MPCMLRVDILVKFKEGVDDPEGKSIKHALELLGFEKVKTVKVGKMYTIYLNCDKEEGYEIAESMVRKLLVNPVIHEYEIRVEEV